MTLRTVCAPESSSGFPSWINWLNKNSYLLLCPILLIDYKYYHYYIPTHSRIISKFFWVITAESTHVRATSWTNPLWVRPQIRNYFGWMPKHMTDWWMYRKDSPRHLCLGEKLNRCHCKCLILIISFTVLHPDTSQQQFTALQVWHSPRGVQVNVRVTAHQPSIPCAQGFKNETQFSTNDTPHAKVNMDFRNPICIFKENLHSTIYLTLNFYLSNHLRSPLSSTLQLQEIYPRIFYLVPKDWKWECGEPWCSQLADKQPHGAKWVFELPLYVHYRESAEKKTSCINVFIFLLICWLSILWILI